MYNINTPQGLCGTQEPAKPIQEREIEYASKMLDSELQNIINVIDQLYSRLSPVMSGLRPVNISDEQRREVSSLFAQGLIETAEKIRYVKNVMNDILDRLEL